MTQSLDKIRARIRQLRKMTVDNGCTEAEALSAAEIAMKLMDHYGLGDGDIEFNAASQATPGRRRQVIDSLWNTVAWVCACEGWIDRRNGRLSYVYFGRPSDVVVAEYLHELLAGSYRRECAAFKASAEYRKRRTRRTRSAALKAFQAGMVAMFRRNMMNLWWKRAPQNSEAGREDLLASQKRHLALLGSELARRGLSFNTMASVRLADRRFDDARWHGLRAGQSVTIDPGVGVGGAVGLLSGTKS